MEEKSIRAVSFNGQGEPIDPSTGEKLDIPTGVAAALSGIKRQEPNLTVKDVTAKDAKPVPVQAQSEAKVEGPPESKPEPPSSRTPTKYEVSLKDSFTVRFGVVLRDGRMVVVKQSETDVVPGTEPHWVKFRMWRYPEELQWKNEATVFDEGKRIHTLNNDKLNEIKLRNLLLDWSFGVDNINLRLMHAGGTLSDESLELFFNLYPTIVRYIIDRMNEVLEYNA